MKYSIAAILIALVPWTLGCGQTEETAEAPPAPEDTKSAPVYAASNQISTVATVEAVDKERREVTLKGPQGNTIVCAVDESVRNFGQLEAGDQVQITYVEAAAVEIVKKDEANQEHTVIERGPEGEKPGGKAVREASMTAEVVGIDHSAGTITLKSTSGKISTVAVRRPERLDQVKVGDFLRVTYRESLALKVEPAAHVK